MTSLHRINFLGKIYLFYFNFMKTIDLAKTKDFIMWYNVNNLGCDIFSYMMDVNLVYF